MAFLFAELGFVWVLYWLYVVVGTFAYKNHQCELEHPEANFDMSSPDYDTDICHPPGLVILGFLLSLYWTNTIIMVRVRLWNDACFETTLALKQPWSYTQAANTTFHDRLVEHGASNCGRGNGHLVFR